MHPSHSIFSLESTVPECYACPESVYLAIASVRSPSRDPRGPLEPSHEVRALSHFHPQLVSMVSFRLANVLERVVLRKDPFNLPSERLKRATVEYLVRHIQKILQSMTEHDRLLKVPQNERQRRAHVYRLEQEVILREILADIEETT